MPGPAVYRRAGLPVKVLETLHFPRTGRLLEEITSGRRRTAEEGQAIADALHPVIGQTPPGSALRPRLIGLRRAIHSGRQPAKQEWGPELSALLPASLAGRISRWLADRTALAATESTIGDILAAEQEQRRPGMLAAASEPGFRLALDGTSPVLAKELAKWIEEPDRVPRSRTIQGVARYLARAAAKTSPLSAFLTSGPVRWAPDGPAVVTHEPDRYGVFELSYQMLREEIARLVVTRPAVRDRVILTLNPTVLPMGERIIYIDGRVAEAVCTIPAKPVLRQVVDLLRHRTAGLSRKELCAHFVGDDLGVADQVEAFMDYLVEAGLLVAGLPAARIEDVVAAATAWLGSSAEPELATELRGLHLDLATPLPVAHGAAYRARRDRLVAGVRRLGDYLDAGNPNREVLGSDPSLHVRDTVVSQEPVATCSASSWEAVTTELDVLRRWLAPFSPSLPIRLALTELLGDRVRARGEVPVVEFYRDYQHLVGSEQEVANELRRWISGGTMWSHESVLAGPRRLAAIMDDARTAVLAPHPPAGRNPVAGPGEQRTATVDMQALREAPSRYPAWVPELRSITAAIQIVSEDEHGPRVAVNSLFTGHGSFRARLDHLTSAPLRKPVDDNPGAPMLVGFRDRFGSSLNDHQPLLPYELEGPPFFVPAHDEPGVIPIADLSVFVDDTSGLLSLRSISRRRTVQVVHTGFLGPTSLPPFSRLLTILSGERPPRLPYPGVRPDEATGRVTRPRLVAERLVLRRACARVPVSQLPAPRPGEGDGQFLLRLWEWRLANDLPQRCFFRIWERESATAPWAAVKWRKPMYLDFGSWFLVLGLLGAARRPDVQEVLFEEALPDPLAPGADPDHHVGEFAVDVPLAG